GPEVNASTIACGARPRISSLDGARGSSPLWQGLHDSAKMASPRVAPDGGSCAPGRARVASRISVKPAAAVALRRRPMRQRTRLRFTRAPGGFAATGKAAVIDRSDALGQLDVLAARSLG